MPTPDVSDTSYSLSGNSNGGTIALSNSTAPLTGDRAAVLGNANLVDLIGYGASATYEGAVKSTGYSLTASLNRTGAADTDVNADDFVAGAPTPVACGEACDGGGTPVDPPVEKTIAEIQGTGPASPLAGKAVTTQGVVTAVYKTGGFSGAYLQTDGTGGAIDLATHTASDGIFVFSSAFAAAVDKGDLVEVTGTVSEFNDLTELSTSTGELREAGRARRGRRPGDRVVPAERRRRRSRSRACCSHPQGDFTITNNYATNQYAEIGLAPGTKPFDTPTNVVAPGASGDGPEGAERPETHHARRRRLDQLLRRRQSGHGTAVADG